jgi:hypothetical protein
LVALDFGVLPTHGRLSKLYTLTIGKAARSSVKRFYTVLLARCAAGAKPGRFAAVPCYNKDMPDPKRSDLVRARVDAVVASGEMSLTRQRRLIEQLAAAGQPTARAREFLASLERHADEMAARRQRLLDQADGPVSASRRLRLIRTG